MKKSELKKIIRETLIEAGYMSKIYSRPGKPEKWSSLNPTLDDVMATDDEILKIWQMDEGGKIYTAKGDGSVTKAQTTTSVFDHGIPVLKTFSRNGYKNVKLPKGRFKILETPKWWYAILRFGGKRVWCAFPRDGGTPPFDY